MRHSLRLAARLLILLVIPCLSLSNASAQANPVLCWGSNGFGELGDSTTASHPLPSPAFYLSSIKQISAGGGDHTLVF